MKPFNIKLEEIKRDLWWVIPLTLDYHLSVWPALESTWTLAEHATRCKLIARREKKEREPAGPNMATRGFEYRGNLNTGRNKDGEMIKQGEGERRRETSKNGKLLWDDASVQAYLISALSFHCYLLLLRLLFLFHPRLCNPSSPGILSVSSTSLLSRIHDIQPTGLKSASLCRKIFPKAEGSYRNASGVILKEGLARGGTTLRTGDLRINDGEREGKLRLIFFPLEIERNRAENCVSDDSNAQFFSYDPFIRFLCSEYDIRFIWKIFPAFRFHRRLQCYNLIRWRISDPL